MRCHTKYLLEGNYRRALGKAVTVPILAETDNPRVQPPKAYSRRLYRLLSKIIESQR